MTRLPLAEYAARTGRFDFVPGFLRRGFLLLSFIIKSDCLILSGIVKVMLSVHRALDRRKSPKLIPDRENRIRNYPRFCRLAIGHEQKHTRDL